MRLTKTMMAWAVPCLVYAAAPNVADVQVVQDDQRLVTISYTLGGADAIVTMDVMTNGVSIGYALYANASGDVNVKVKQGARRITWQPRTTWPDQKIRDNSLSVKLTAWALDNPPDYMSMDLTMPSNRLWYVNAEAVPFGVTNDVYKTEKLLMRRIHAAGVRWRKGSSQGQDTGHLGTEPSYPVILTKDYYIGVFKVTYRQHALFANPASTDMGSAMYPKQNVNSANLRGDVSTYDWYANGSLVNPTLPIGLLRAYTGIETFDLPSDAQWEFACLGGTAHPRFGVSTSDLPKYAWYASSDYTKYGATGSKAVQQVGLLLPNPYGLYDILGNGSELCNDWYGEGDDYAGVDRILIMVRTDFSKPDPFTMPTSEELKAAIAVAHRHGVLVNVFFFGDAGLRREAYEHAISLGADSLGTERTDAFFAWLDG